MNTESIKILRFLKNLALIFLIVFFLFAFPNLLSLLTQAIMPILIGFMIAFVLNILCSFYEDHLFKKSSKKPRALCIILSVLSVLLVIVLIALLVIPQFITCIKTFMDKAPSAVDHLLQTPLVSKLLPPETTNQLSNFDWSSLIEQAGDFLIGGMGNITSTILSTISLIASAFIGIVFSLYFLTGKTKILNAFRRWGKYYLPEKYYSTTGRFLALLNTCAHKYVVGQCTEALILGGLCALGMLVFQMPYATMIGALVGLLSLIPLVGALIGGIIGAFMILTVSPAQALGFLIFFLILQQLEGNLIYPRVVGSSVGLPGVLMLAAVTIGGTLFGFIGMIAFVPICAAVYTWFKPKEAKTPETT